MKAHPNDSILTQLPLKDRISISHPEILGVRIPRCDISGNTVKPRETPPPLKPVFPQQFETHAIDKVAWFQV